MTGIPIPRLDGGDQISGPLEDGSVFLILRREREQIVVRRLEDAPGGIAVQERDDRREATLLIEAVEIVTIVQLRRHGGGCASPRAAQGRIVPAEARVGLPV